MGNVAELETHRTKAKFLRRHTGTPLPPPPNVSWRLSRVENSAGEPLEFSLTLQASGFSQADFSRIGCEIVADIESLAGDAERRELRAELAAKRDVLRAELATLLGGKLIELRRLEVAVGC